MKLTRCDNYKVTVPEGRSGNWAVERFAVSEEDAAFTRIRQAATQGRERAVPAGAYTRLMLGGEVVMSDTPAEIQDHLEFINRARGRVLVHGLGLGVCLAAALRKPEVDHVTVVEKSSDVLKLVAPHYRAQHNGRLTIIKGDAFCWTPPRGSRWNVVWHDVWNTICGDNLDDMRALKARFRKRCHWQGCWSEEWLR